MFQNGKIINDTEHRVIPPSGHGNWSFLHSGRSCRIGLACPSAFVTKLEQDHVLPPALGTSDIPNEEGRRMSPKKQPADSKSTRHPCSQCEYLERQYEGAITHIRDVLGTRFQSLRDKICELQKWQESRNEAIEALYAHKRLHRLSPRHAPGQNAA